MKVVALEGISRCRFQNRRNFKWIVVMLFAAAAIPFWYYRLEGFEEPYKYLLNRTTLQIQQALQSHGSKPKIILVYNPGHRLDKLRQKITRPFPYNVFEEGKIPLNRCPQRSNCIITYDNRLSGISDAVIFSLTKQFDVSTLLHRRKEMDNSWIFLQLESPVNTQFDVDRLKDVFDLTATYKKYSDMETPYYIVMPLEKNDSKPHISTNYAEGKTKMVLSMMSNCVPYRIDFIKSMKKYVDVSLYGKCQSPLKKRTEESCKNHDKQCNEIQKSFKFFLALENSFCDDYVTEKFYHRGLGKGLVPIVLNGGNLSNIDVAPPHSYINVLDFKDMKSLTDHLLYLDKNDTAYNEYHAWKRDYKIGYSDYACTLCDQTWRREKNGNTTRTKTMVDLSIFWSKSQCKDFKMPLFKKYLL